MAAHAFLIRNLRVEDCDQLFLLMREKQELQNIKGPVASPDELKRNGCGSGIRFNCLVAERFKPGMKATKIIGYSTFHCYFSGWSGQYVMNVDSIYEGMGYRSLGVQSALLKAICKIAIDKRCMQIDWLSHNINTTCNALYKRYGAMNVTSLNGLQQYRFDKMSMEAFAIGNTINTEHFYSGNAHTKERNLVI